MSNWGYQKHWAERQKEDPWGLKWERNTSATTDLYKKLDERDTRRALGNMLINFMSPAEIVNVFTRMLEHELPPNKLVKLSDINKARLLIMYPQLESVFDFDEFEDNLKLALALRDFDRFIGDIDINLLSRKQIKLFFDIAAQDGKRTFGKVNKKPLQYLAKNMLPERMDEIFTIQMWREFIHHFPSKANLIDIKKLRNQTELRRFILDKPHIMRWQTIDDMKNCIIDGPTWGAHCCANGAK